MRKDNKKKQIPYINVLEVKVVDHCNFRCIACGTFSNIAEAKEYGVAKFENDLIRLKKLGFDIGLIRLYGGEPLLADNLLDYIYVIKRRYCLSKIEIVTNGFFINDKSDTFWEEIRKYNIKIVVSYYNEKNMKVRKGIEYLQNNGVENEIIPTRHFYVLQDFNQKHDPYISRKRCVVSIATYMHDSRLYACPYPFSYVHYDKKYGTNYSCIEDGIDIYSGKTADEILALLKQPMKFCQNCKEIPSYVKWQQQKPKKTDWLANKENKYIDEGYSYYNFLLDVDHLNYIIVDENKKYCMKKEAGLDKYKKYIAIYDSELSLKLLEDTFLHTAEKLKLEYEICHFKNLVKRSNNEDIIYMLFIDDLKIKKKIVTDLSKM